MASMGQLLTLGMAISLIAVLIVLPALMRIGRRP
jgi:predicted RND superfamily exporter protein